MNTIRNVVRSLIRDLPPHKLVYVIQHRTLVAGIWGNIEAYGIPYSKENHEILIDLVQTALNGPDIEREWTEEEYNNFVCFQK